MNETPRSWRSSYGRGLESAQSLSDEDPDRQGMNGPVNLRDRPSRKPLDGREPSNSVKSDDLIVNVPEQARHGNVTSADPPFNERPTPFACCRRSPADPLTRDVLWLRRCAVRGQLRRYSLPQAHPLPGMGARHEAKPPIRRAVVVFVLRRECRLGSGSCWIHSDAVLPTDKWPGQRAGWDLGRRPHVTCM
jgi:hypothetical protein